jgi:hypothetical protein
MKFMAKNTSIFVPKVYGLFDYKNRAYIAMEKIQGDVIPMA